MNTIVPNQYGLRHNRSTIHAMLDLITTCHDKLNCKKFSALIFLDIQKAFDSVSHQKLLKKLEYYGIRGVANSLICSYLRNHKQYVSIYNKRSSEKLFEYGIPQGSILGHLLFLIYVNDLPSCMQTVPRFFADDTALLTTENNADNLQHLTNSELSRVSNWMLANNLMVNQAKTVALLVFPQTRKSTISLTLNFDNQIVQPSESAKYLGIFVNEHLSFKPHIIFLEKNIARSVGVLAKQSYYLPCNTLIILYYSLVHTHLHYALPLWGATYKSYLIKLKMLQNKALRFISKTKIRGRITPQYYKYEILKLEDLYNFEIAKLMYQFTHSKLPFNFKHYFAYSSDVSSYSTCHSFSNDIFLPRFMSSKTQHSIKYIGAKIRNNIPFDLKNTPYSKFKESYKKFLLSKYKI